MNPACFIQPDLSVVRVRGGGVDTSWAAPAETTRVGASALSRAQDRARQAASFVAETLGRSRKLGTVVVGVQGAICARVSAPSAAPEVVAAALAKREREWTGEQGATGVYVLSEPRRGRAGAEGGRHHTVIELHDALVRLFLEELDRRGLSPESVQSLWHALAVATPRRAELTSVLLIDDESAVWAWSRHGGLIAGGSARSASTAEAVPRRVRLDWLSWGAQIGGTPGEVVVIAESPDAIADDIAATAPDVKVTARAERDPLGAALDAAARAEPAPDDPRACLSELANLPGRAHRWLGVWGAAAIVLLAVAVLFLGVRQRQTAREADAVAASIRASVRDRVAAIEPRFADDAAPERALRSLLAEERERTKPIEAPPPPRPIAEELARLTAALAVVLGDTENADTRLIKIDEVNGEATVFVPDFATGEAVLDRLRAAPGAMRWSGTFLGPTPPTTQRLTGVWQELAP